IEAEEEREFHHSSGRAVDAQELALALDLGRLDLVRERQEDQQVDKTDRRVEVEEGSIRIRALEPQRGEEADRRGRERAECAGERCDGVVDREQPGAALVRGRLWQDRLLDGLEDADLRARRADRRSEEHTSELPVTFRSRM